MLQLLKQNLGPAQDHGPRMGHHRRSDASYGQSDYLAQKAVMSLPTSPESNYTNGGGPGSTHLCDQPSNNQSHYYFDQHQQQQHQQQLLQQTQPHIIDPLSGNLEIKKELDADDHPNQASIATPYLNQEERKSPDYRVANDITRYNKDSELAKQPSGYISQERNSICPRPDYFEFRGKGSLGPVSNLLDHASEEVDFRKYRGQQPVVSESFLRAAAGVGGSNPSAYMHDVSKPQEDFSRTADQPLADSFQVTTDNDGGGTGDRPRSRYDRHTADNEDPPEGLDIFKANGSNRDLATARASLQIVAGEKKQQKEGDMSIDSADPLRLKPLREAPSPKGSPPDGSGALHSDSGIVNDGGSNSSSNSGSSGVDHDDSGTLRNVVDSHSNSAFKFEGPNPSLEDLKTSEELSSTFMPSGAAPATGVRSHPSRDEEDEEEGEEEDEGDHHLAGSPVYPPLPSISGSGLPLVDQYQPRPGSAGPPRSSSTGSNTTSSRQPFMSPGGNTASSPRQLLPSPMTPNSSQSRSPPEPQPIFDNGKEVYFCHLCSYVGTSKFHFNQHMNSHFEHRCPHCDYTSRTEGRLKRHIKDFHSEVPPDNYSGSRTIRNQPPRPKVYKCKQCDFVSITKVDFWEHSRTHIKEDKVLQCPKCPFVTEYKHHLEYHLRNHFGSKPFKCPKCNYSCVNKSMLNSHMKSHTNVYQYRCADCTYATKYCHSLKLHLKKYNHKPATVLNADGSLPTDGSGDFELVSKRGPPRGPRGPRRDRSPQRMVNPMMMSQVGMNGLHPPLNGGLLGPGYWPMMAQLPNGLHPPPPLIPVSGAGPPGGHPGHLNPGIPLHLMATQHEHQDHHKQQVEGRKSAEAPLIPTGEAGDRSSKCILCDFKTDSRASLGQHMLEVHAAENQDLFNMFGIPPDSLSEESCSQKPGDAGGSGNRPEVSETAATPIKQEVVAPPSQTSPAPANPAWSLNPSQPGSQRASPTDPFPSPLYRSTPHGAAMPSAMELMHQQMIKERYNAVIAAEIASNIEAEAKLNGECPLDLTKRKNQLELAASQMFLPPEMMQLHLQGQKRRFEEMAAMAAVAAAAGPGSQNPDQSPPPLEGMSQTPRKRSRKGKAYKLDTICQKLQERYGDSPTPDSNEEDTSDSAGQRSENADGSGQRQQLHRQLSQSSSQGGQYKNGGDSDSNGVGEQIDYSEIHNSLRELNRQTYPGGPGEKSGEQVPADGGHGSSFTGTVNRRKLLMVRHSREQTARQEASIVNGQQQRPRSQPTNYDQQAEEEVNSPKEARPSSAYECSHCEISFKDCIMYTMHMGYHGYQDPFKCNMCGHTSKNRVEFFLHIARAAHE